jgi:hypothetical protein
VTVYRHVVHALSRLLLGHAQTGTDPPFYVERPPTSCLATTRPMQSATIYKKLVRATSALRTIRAG